MTFGRVTLKKFFFFFRKQKKCSVLQYKRTPRGEASFVSSKLHQCLSLKVIRPPVLPWHCARPHHASAIRGAGGEAAALARVLCRGVWHASWISQSLARTSHPLGSRKSLKVCVTRFWKNQYPREATAGSCSLQPFRRLGSPQSEGAAAG